MCSAARQKNEGIARELAKLVEDDPERARKLWEALTAENPDPTALEVRAFIRDPKPAAPPKADDDRTRRTIHYIKTILAEHYPEPTGLKPSMKGWKGDRNRKAFLSAVHRYVQEQLFLAHGANRSKQKYLQPFEEPSAEFPDGRI